MLSQGCRAIPLAQTYSEILQEGLLMQQRRHKDMLERFVNMKQDARERDIRITDDQLVILVLADIVEDHGIAVVSQLETQ